MLKIKNLFVFVICTIFSFMALADNKISEELIVAKSYNKDFQGGKESLYNERFGARPTIPREEKIITNVFNNTLNRIKNRKKDDATIILLDFGCGDGRFLEFFQQIAQNNQDVQIELIGYDISVVGLNEYANKLNKNNYNKLQDTLENDDVYTFGIWQNKNLKITLIHSNISNDLDKLQLIINKPIDVIFNMFSVLCHIPGKKNRQNVIKQLGNLMDKDGEMIVNVSTPKSIEEEFITYKTLRTQLDIAKKFGQKEVADALNLAVRSATEDGDLYYSKSNNVQATHTYGHAYSKQELVEDINYANLTVKEVGIMSISQPHELSRNFWKKYQDYIFSIILSFDLPFYPFNISDQITKNIYAIANK